MAPSGRRRRASPPSDAEPRRGPAERRRPTAYGSPQAPCRLPKGDILEAAGGDSTHAPNIDLAPFAAAAAGGGLPGLLRPRHRARAAAPAPAAPPAPRTA